MTDALKREYLQAESRCGHLVTSEMKGVWLCLLEMLEVVLDVCKRNSLHVEVDGGSLLGAIRHGGIIPWDDDIDVNLPRPDYDKLLALLPKELPSHMRLQTSRNSPQYWVAHAKIRYAGTCGIIESHAKRHVCFDMGIFLDIFPLDGVPSGTFKRRLFMTILTRMRAMRQRAYAKGGARFAERVKCLVYRLVFHIIPNTWWYELREMVLRFTHIWSVDFCRTCPAEFGWFPRHSADRVAWHKKIVELPFEHLQVPCPSEGEKILSALYGEWRKLVKGGGVHGGVIQSATIPYQRILRERFGYTDAEIRQCEA